MEVWLPRKEGLGLWCAAAPEGITQDVVFFGGTEPVLTPFPHVSAEVVDTQLGQAARDSKLLGAALWVEIHGVA